LKDQKISHPTSLTIIPREINVYSAFPTLVVHEGRVYVFYRRGYKNPYQCHGLGGAVRRFEMDAALLLDAFSAGAPQCVYPLGRDITIFTSENELDAIVSAPDGGVYTLCTRTYVRDAIAATFVSHAPIPDFDGRNEVKIDGIQWLVFYGKSMKWRNGFVFPAYGVLSGRGVMCPLVLFTRDFSAWSLISHVDAPSGCVLNESSIAPHGPGYAMFMREDSGDRGIWVSQSEDLKLWSAPRKILTAAHAPMAAVIGGEIFLSFRRLIGNGVSAAAYIKPYSGGGITDVEVYRGSLFDGGYTDWAVIGGRVFLVYYAGNEGGEPCIRMTEVY